MANAIDGAIHRDKALVLGGGGPVGRAWEAGLVSGLMAQGVALNSADTIVGTSAGAIVGAQLALRLDLTVVAPAAPPPPLPPAASNALAELAKMTSAAWRAADPESRRQAIGQLALTAATPSEEQSMARVAIFSGRAWPAGLCVTAVNAQTGASVFWQHGSGIALDRAVAASCALPGVWPPITIGGQRFMDGGIRSMVNADLVPGHCAVIVVSCFPLAPPEGLGSESPQPVNSGPISEIEALRAAGANVDVIAPGPDLLALTGGGARMLDPTLVPQAFQIGLQQAIGEASRINAAWMEK